MRAASNSPVARASIHAQHCRCRACRHPELPPIDLQEELRAANRWAWETIIGLAAGLIAAWIVDRFVGGPGILSIFGIGR